MHRQEKARRAACTTTRIEALNADEPLIREDVQPSKVLHVDSAPEEYAESRLLEAASALQKAALVLGTRHMRCWFDEGLLARAQGNMLQIQMQMLAKLQRLNTRALECLHEVPGVSEVANRHPIDSASRIESAKRGCCERDPEFKFLRRHEDGAGRE